jgi:outer membrane protein assembly factor BamB
MTALNLPLNKHFFNFSVLLLIVFAISCKKDSKSNTPTPAKAVVYVGGQDNNLYALNAQNGNLIWKYKSGGNFSYSAPTLVNGILYSTNVDHNLYALDAASGKLKWKFAAASTVISSPAVVNGIVYFGSDDHYIYAVDAISGNLKWKYQTTQNVDSNPAVSNGVVYIGCADGNLYALDAIAGNLKWKYYTGSPIVESSVVVSNNVIFIGNRGGYLSAINADNGQLKWIFSADGISLEQSRPLINNGVIYLASWYNVKDFKQAGSLYAIKESDGSLIWKGLNGQGFTSGPVYADGKIFINSDDRNMYAVDATTGMEIWKKSIVANGAVPTVANGKVFAGGGGSNAFYVLDASTGNESWKLSLTNCITTSKPLVVDEN